VTGGETALERAESLLGCPGLVHGFSTRLAGDLGLRHAALPEVRESFRRLAAVGGFALDRLRTVKQVHGAGVVDAASLAATAEADALFARRADGPCVVAVGTADCVPVLLSDRAGSVVGAAHSGWRGTVAGVVPALVAAMTATGVAASELVAAIGPCIGTEAFEVGPEVAERFPGEARVRREWPRPHVDLVAAVTRQLLQAGLAATAITRTGGCTYTDRERYFSYRRDGAGTGQHLSFIGFAGE
jgi:hypothetical protein